MSTPNIATVIRYEGNGVATQFTIPFPYQKREYVKVYIARKGEVMDTELRSEQFTFETDNVVSFPVLDSDKILGEGDTLAIRRVTDLGSPYVFDNTRRLFPEDVMNADDLSFQQIQEIREDVDRALKVPLTSAETAEELFETLNNGIKSANQAAANAAASAEEAKGAIDLAKEAGKEEADKAKDYAEEAQASADEALNALADCLAAKPYIHNNLVVSDFQESKKYEGYIYEAHVSTIGRVSDIKETDYVELVFNFVDATGGNYAPIAETFNGYVAIYSKENKPVTIPTVLIYRG